MRYSRNMTPAHAVDDLAYACGCGLTSGDGTNGQPNILSLSNLDCEGKNRTVSNRDEL
jgi:hypothetical protein